MLSPPQSIPPDPFGEVCERITGRAGANEMAARWPSEDIDDLAGVEATRWAIGAQFGGRAMSALDLHDRYEQIAAASLATALVLSQRDAAAGYLEASANDELKSRLLPKLAENQQWATIGISHLTTSTAGKLTATRTDDGYAINGLIPWTTGGGQADFIVAGALTDDAQQLVFVLPTKADGVRVLPPTQLATLAAAPTCPVECESVSVPASSVIAGPAERALAQRTSGLPIGQAFAALGLAGGALRLIKQINSAIAEASYETFNTQLNELRNSVRHINAAPDSHDLQSGPLLRSECNNLAIRVTHAAVTLYKGAGLRIEHPAQRLAREALFLLVWSSPASVVDRTLELMSEPM